ASENNTINQPSDSQTTDINDPSNPTSRLSTTGVAAASALTQWALSALSFSSRLLPASSSATTTTNTTITTESVTQPTNKQEPSISNSTFLSSMNKTSKVIEKGDEKLFGKKD
ncbi:unnamed protein product, partial [Trichobilharzia regenti]